jgi:hypothetical protein
MVYYFIPPLRAKILEWGEEISGDTFKELMEDVEEHQVLLGLFLRGTAFMAVFLETEAHYNDIMLRCRKTDMQQFGFFAVHKVCFTRAKAGLPQTSPP